MRKCEEDRFGVKSEDAKILGITNFFMCIENLDFYLQGGYESQELLLLQINVDYCNQTFLNLQSPGQNKTCKSIEEINKILPLIWVYEYKKNYYLDYQL